MRKLLLITVLCLFTVQAYAKSPMQVVKMGFAQVQITTG